MSLLKAYINYPKNSGLVFLMLIFLIGCHSKPEPIVFGKDQCYYCKMSIADPQFGAELITAKGRIYKYDALECMINHIHEEAPDHQQLLAIAYDRPKQLFPVDSLSFVQSPDYRSPMGENLAAFYDVNALKGNERLTWAQIYQTISDAPDK